MSPNLSGLRGVRNSSVLSRWLCCGIVDQHLLATESTESAECHGMTASCGTGAAITALCIRTTATVLLFGTDARDANSGIPSVCSKKSFTLSALYRRHGAAWHSV